MSHLGQEVLRRILSGEGGAREAEQVAEHLVSCERCRSQAGTVLDGLRAEQPGFQGTGSLQLVFGLIDRERQWGLESLAAMAEWAELRKMSGRRSQRERVRMAKECHTLAFEKLVLDELKEESSWDQAEFFAGLALLSVEGMSQRQMISPATSHDLQAEVWTAVANARRKAAEWTRTHRALDNAAKLLKAGAGDLRLEASLLSITASTLADEGQVKKALEMLERCREIYSDLSEWPLLARALVQKANILAGIEPGEGLITLDRAASLIPTEDSYLVLLADLLRVECLIEVQKPNEALRFYRHCSRQLVANPRVRMRIRGKFTGARLMDALGFEHQAERLFDEVVAGDIEHELYKDAFLDLLYLYGRHMKAGDLEKAVRVCQKALTDPTLSAVAHEQIRDLWTQLLEAANHQAISQERLKDLRVYFSVHWKHPAATPPAVAGR